MINCSFSEQLWRLKALLMASTYFHPPNSKCCTPLCRFAFLNSVMLMCFAYAIDGRSLHHSLQRNCQRLVPGPHLQGPCIHGPSLSYQWNGPILDAHRGMLVTLERGRKFVLTQDLSSGDRRSFPVCDALEIPLHRVTDQLHR